MEYKIPQNYRYTEDHEWVIRDEKNHDVVRVGITDYAQDTLGEIVHIEFPSISDMYEKSSEIAVIESAKSASEIYAPVTGRIFEINDSLDTSPEEINKSPYEDGWIFKIKLDDIDELDELLTADGYINYINELDR
jgi:glycine cleavage system H protein